MPSNPKFGVKDALVAGAAFALWLVTVALGLWEVYVLRQLYYLLYARVARHFGGDFESADVVGYCLLPVLAFGFIAFAIGTAEWHRLNLGRPRSWKVFAVTIAIQLAILLIYEVI
ncbi:MAG: hypothetical protein NZM18_13075 [Thermoflexales bacterium]|nr:hypothetical protein [Thermoflexales bacterium]MDW8351181.1 hypothetical protein [Anaerolineae bacterium]